jgi:dihydrofolate reductase
VPQLFADISISLDGYAAGPNPSLDDPLGAGGEQLHEWAFPLKAWREPHGMQGGEENADSDLVTRVISRAGADIMGRRMFSNGEGPWDDDPKANGWWGDNPPFHHPVFVLTHHARDPLEMEGGTTFTFVTDGIESALEQARAAAGESKDVRVSGGADAIQQYIRAGLLDELHIHVAPILLGGGRRLLENLEPMQMSEAAIAASPRGVAHLSYVCAKSRTD